MLNEIINKKIPILCFTIIAFYYLWALWIEIPLTATVYNGCVMLMFAWMAITFAFNRGNNICQHSLTIMEMTFLLIWCSLMLSAYQMQSHHMTVNFFGIELDSYARIMVYWMLVLVPGIAFSSFVTISDSKLFKVLLICIILTSLIYSVRATIVFPDALRARSTAESLGHEELLFGLPTYSMIYSFALIVPWLLYRTHSGAGKTRWYYFIATASVVIMIVISQFATALLAMVVGLLVYLVVYNIISGRGIVSVFIIALVLILFGTGAIGSLFGALADVAEGAWAEKLTEMAEYFSGGASSGDLETRFDLYGLSLKVFEESPIFGMVTNKARQIGGHASLLDSMALCGIFGLMFWLGMMITSFRRLLSFCRSKDMRCAAVASFVSWVFLWVAKNIISALALTFTWFVLLPVLFSMEVDNNESHKETDI